MLHGRLSAAWDGKDLFSPWQRAARVAKSKSGASGGVAAASFKHDVSGTDSEITLSI